MYAESGILSSTYLILADGPGKGTKLDLRESKACIFRCNDHVALSPHALACLLLVGVVRIDRVSAGTRTISITLNLLLNY